MSAACRARPICSPFWRRASGATNSIKGRSRRVSPGPCRRSSPGRSRSGSTASATASRARSPIRSMFATGSPASARRPAARSTSRPRPGRTATSPITPNMPSGCTHRAGFILQIDAPDLGSARHNQYQHLSDAEFLRIAERNIAALNHATRDIPPEAMRMHIYWGNYEGPHTHDIPLATVLGACMRARPQALLFEAANPRHAHEWEDLKAARIPGDKILMPGLIDSTTNFVEHPRLVAQRICQYADIVGRERVIAGTDCGFATFAAQQNPVVPSIVWAKLASLTEGARIASDRLWGRQ